MVRLPEFYGPSVVTLTARVFRAALGDRRAMWPGPSEVAIELIYMPDAARALVEIATAADCDGAVFHLPGARTTPRQSSSLIFALRKSCAAHVADAAIASIPGDCASSVCPPKLTGKSGHATGSSAPEAKTTPSLDHLDCSRVYQLGFLGVTCRHTRRTRTFIVHYREPMTGIPNSQQEPRHLTNAAALLAELWAGGFRTVMSMCA